MNALVDRISREPVLGFGAFGLSITAWAPSWVDTDAKKAAVAGILLWLQRVFSTSKKSANEQVEVAKYVAAVDQQNLMHTGQLLADPKPPSV